MDDGVTHWNGECRKVLQRRWESSSDLVNLAKDLREPRLALPGYTQRPIYVPQPRLSSIHPPSIPIWSQMAKELWLS